MKKAIVFGVGLAFKQYYDLINYKYDICAVTDNDVSKHGTYFNGVLCIEPTQILNYHPDVVIVTPIALEARMKICDMLCKMCPAIEVIYVEECKPAIFSRKNITDNVLYEDNFHNVIVCGNNVSIRELNIQFEGINNRVEIGSQVKVDGYIHLLCRGNGNWFAMGENTRVVSANCELSEAGKIIIGKDCMLSWDIDIFQTAFHPIYDMETGERVNKKKDIIIGDHVWIGKGVGILPGSEIGEGSIIGYGSVMAKKYPAHCTLAGRPAKVLRENVCWERDVTGFYPMDKML